MTKIDDDDVKTVVLRKNLDDDEAMDIVNQKKITPFKSLLSRPKKEDIHVSSLKLYYECILLVSGKYTADYFRKAKHTISVDSNVREVYLGDGIFPIRSKSNLTKALVGKRGKNKIDLELDEHVFIEEQDELTFDHHGLVVEFPFKINSKTTENYPTKILEKNASNVKESKISNDTAIDKLKSQLKKSIDSDIRDLTEEFVLDKITKVYIPIFEARLIGPKKKVSVLRIDSMRKKVL